MTRCVSTLYLARYEQVHVIIRARSNASHVVKRDRGSVRADVLTTLILAGELDATNVVTQSKRTITTATRLIQVDTEIIERIVTQEVIQRTSCDVTVVGGERGVQEHRECRNLGIS